MSRTLLAPRADVLLCEPPKSVGRLGWSTASLGKSFVCIKGLPPTVHPPNIDHGFIRLTRPWLVVHTVPQRHLCILPRVSACTLCCICLFQHARDLGNLTLFFRLQRNNDDRGVINHDQSAVEVFHSHLDRLLIFLVHCKDDRVSPALHRNSAELR
jgi:hypothetical protein